MSTVTEEFKNTIFLYTQVDFKTMNLIQTSNYYGIYDPKL